MEKDESRMEEIIKLFERETKKIKKVNLSDSIYDVFRNSKRGDKKIIWDYVIDLRNKDQLLGMIYKAYSMGNHEMTKFLMQLNFKSMRSIIKGGDAISKLDK
jgi:hypothetical protein